MVAIADPGLPPIAVDGDRFCVGCSPVVFRPYGFNYDHDEHYRLLEDYWEDSWGKVERDFRAMQQLGANTVRIHLQAGSFLANAGELVEPALDRLDRLVALAGSLGIRLHLVGLGCYRRDTVPGWYDALPTEQRWQTQAVFWATLAERYRGNGTIFCFDLMNEPLVPARCRRARGWLGQDYHGSHFTQYIALEGAPETRSRIACDWTGALAGAIRQADPQRLVTIGLVDWSLPHCKPSSGFVPQDIAPLLDFVCLHIYPASGAIDDAVDVVQQFRLGKPLLLDETFPLRCTPDEFDVFLTTVQPGVNGVLGFYTDQVALPLTRHHHERNAAMLAWLRVFRQQRPAYGSPAVT